MSHSPKGNGILDEMAIVDVLTRLIFDANAELLSTEELVLELLGPAEEQLLGASRRDISEYLRSMGVDEMIGLVKTIKQLMDDQHRMIAASSNAKNPSLYR